MEEAPETLVAVCQIAGLVAVRTFSASWLQAVLAAFAVSLIVAPWKAQTQN